MIWWYFSGAFLSYELPQIEAVFDWIEEESQGFPGLVNFRARDLSLIEQDLLERYQLGLLQKDIATHKESGEMSDDLSRMVSLIEQFEDAKGLKVYRGVTVNSRPSIGESWHEGIVSGWSLFPKIAYTIAKVQYGQHRLLLREWCSSPEPALYLDEWEHEIVRLNVVKVIDKIVFERRVDAFGDEGVYVVDLI